MKLVIILLCLSRMPAEQRAIMVWGDRDCPVEIQQTPATRLEAPLKDGLPDMSQAKLTGVRTTYTANCGRVEIRREK